MTNYPLKHERLQQLDDAGFNVADFVCFPTGKLDEKRLAEFLAKHGRISCRHFHPNEKAHFKCPVLYDQDDLEIIRAFCREHNKQYYTLCNQASKVSDSIYAGNIFIRSDREYAVEYFKGSGTPRDIESMNSDQIIYFDRKFGVPMPDETPSEIKSLRASLTKFALDLEIKPVIIEFSIYPYPIGRRQRRSICWEWRQGWLHYAMQHTVHLMEENRRLHDEIARLRAEKSEGTAVA